MNDPQPTACASRGQGGRPNLPEFGGLMVGYALAGTLAKSVMPGSMTLQTGDPHLWPVILGVYVWLGLAMAGPFVMLTSVLGRQRVAQSEDHPAVPVEASWSRGETAWVLVGTYWLVMTLLVVPRGLSEMVQLGLTPGLALIMLGYLPRSASSLSRSGLGRDEPAGRWTRKAALAVMAAWPLTWLGLILLGREWFG